MTKGRLLWNHDLHTGLRSIVLERRLVYLNKGLWLWTITYILAKWSFTLQLRPTYLLKAILILKVSK